MKKTTLALALLASLVLPAPLLRAAEEKPLPKDLPPFGEDRPLPVPAIDTSTLPEGLTVWIVRRPGFPKVTAVLAVRGGTAADPADLPGIGELLGQTIREGTKSRASRQIAEELQGIGGELTAATSDDAVVLAGTALSSGSGRLIELIADVARNASFPEKEVELAKGNALQALEARESTPEYLAEKAFAAAVFGSHPYRIVGATREVIGKTTPALLRAEHARRFRPDQSLLVVSGNVDVGAVKNHVQRAFRGWTGDGVPVPETPAAPVARERELLLVDRPGSVQSLLMVGRPGPKATDPATYPALVANTIFGGAFGSRLVHNIREDKGYTYSPRASVTSYRQGGVLQVRADVRNDVTAAALMEVFYELDRMATTKPTVEELTKAKRYQSGLYLLRNQIQGAVAGTLASNWVKGLPPEALAEFVSKVNAVTADQVREAGRSLFRAATQTVVVVGDAKAVRGEVSLFGAVKDVTP